MSKEPTLNQLEEYIGDAVHDCVAHEFDEKVKDTVHGHTPENIRFAFFVENPEYCKHNELSHSSCYEYIQILCSVGYSGGIHKSFEGGICEVKPRKADDDGYNESQQIFGFGDIAFRGYIFSACKKTKTQKTYEG